MHGKPVAEQEIGFALLQEVVALAETSISRRKFILHYFGEFDNATGEGGDMDDNAVFQKLVEAQDHVEMVLNKVKYQGEIQNKGSFKGSYRKIKCFNYFS